MKTFIPAILLAHLYLIFLLYVLLSYGSLPEPFAIHFNLAGEPKSWTDRSSYVTFFVAIGSISVFSLAIVGFILQWVPTDLINIPHKEYWLAPRRRVETMCFFFRQMLWLACWMAIFLTAMHYLIVDANRQVPVHVPQVEFLSIMGGFLVVISIWALMFLLHFKRKA